MTHTEDETFDVWSLRHSSGIVVDVMTHQETPHERFDERRVGLDHFSLQVTDREELDNIQLELFVHPTPQELAELLAKQG